LAALWVFTVARPAADFALMTGVVNLFALTALAVFGFWRSGELPKFRGGSRLSPFFWAGLLLTAAGGTVVLGELSNLTAWLIPLPSWLARVFDQLSDGPPLVSLFTLALVAPLTEETLFRGLILKSFARRYGNWPGVVLSSALFALFHLNIWQALTAFLAGLYLGWVFLSARSLFPSMVVHGLFNGLPVLLAALGFLMPGYNLPVVPGAQGFQPPLWVLGGLAVLFLGLWLTKKWTPLSPSSVSDRVTT
jgi:membrane protease YdiL (CAAX protease family)